MSARASKGTAPQPLFSHSDDEIEAAHSVSNVARFLVRAIETIDGGLNDAEKDGLRVIMQTCAETLDFHFRKGAAA